MSIFFNTLKRTGYYKNPHHNGKNTSYQKFIVLTYKRSGSNYFIDLLKSHPDIVSFSGIFGNAKLGFGYTGYPPGEHQPTIKYRNRYPLHFIKKRIFTKYADNIRAVGFKMTYDTQFPMVLNYVKKHPEIKIIHLIRKNLLNIHLSEMIALRTKMWHAVDASQKDLISEIGAASRIRMVDDPGKPVLDDNFSIELSYENCVEEFKRIEEYRRKYKIFFLGNETLTVTYEDINFSRNKEIARILSFLGVTPHEPESRFVKINRNPQRKVISNYDELKEKFKGSAWSQFFEE